MPLRAEGMSKSKAFLCGTLSGIVEPIGALLTILAAQHIIACLPYFLSFAAGAMLYVVVEELIPEMSQGRHSNLGTDDGSGCRAGVTGVNGLLTSAHVMNSQIKNFLT